MTKFKIGERVAVYDTGGRRRGTVQNIRSGDFALIRLDGYPSPQEWHIKQLRRLKPKDKPAKAPEPRKAREWWITENLDAYPANGELKAPNANCVHVIEKLPDHVLVSREELEKAWSDAWIDIGYVENFDLLCKALGLSEKGGVE